MPDAPDPNDRDTNDRDTNDRDTNDRDTTDQKATDQEAAPESAAEQPPASARHRLGDQWQRQLGPTDRSAVLAWAAFAATFTGVRALTHWLRDGHGPAGGGVRVGGHHFHHYNLGITGLAAVGALTIRGQERHHRHPATALTYGAATALIVDEAALLLDLKDVYWAKQGRTSVDLAVGVIAVGGLAVAGSSFWPAAARELARNRRSAR